MPEFEKINFHLATVIDGKLYYGFELTKKFLQVAESEGADLKPTKSRKFLRWDRNLGITKDYIQGSSTLEQIGNDINISREAVRQIVEKTVYYLWLNCSAQTQSLFPYQEIPLGKPLTLEVRRQNSLSRGGVSATIAELIQVGRNPAEIMQQTDISRRQLSKALKVVRSWGMEVPAGKKSLARRLNQQAAERLTGKKAGRRQTQKLLDQVTYSLYQYQYRRGEGSPLIPVGKIAKESGLHFRDLKMLISILKECGIPVREIQTEVKSGPQKVKTNHFTALSYLEEVRQIFAKDPRLEAFRQNPVVQILGPDIDLPTSYQLVHSPAFRRVATLLSEFGIKVNFKTKVIDILDQNCPAPVFKLRNRGAYYYPINQEEALREFIAQRTSD